MFWNDPQARKYVWILLGVGCINLLLSFAAASLIGREQEMLKRVSVETAIAKATLDSRTPVIARIDSATLAQGLQLARVDSTVRHNRDVLNALTEVLESAPRRTSRRNP